MTGLTIAYQDRIADGIAAGGLEVIRRICAQPSVRRQLTRAAGYSLLEAPTGAGKTRILGMALERLSADADVVAFWFAPFSGVVGQAHSALAAGYPALRPRDITTDRSSSGTRSGDVFVMTWSAVAANNRDARRVRTDGDTPSIDALVADLRARGFAIVAIVDEAHHSFRPGTEAWRFWTDVLQPDLAVLATATPGDDKIQLIRTHLGLTGLNQYTVSRREAVEAGLVKANATSVICTPRNRVAGEIELDPSEVALRAGVAQHRRIIACLADLGISMTPLLLVQASTEWSPDRVKSFLANDCNLGAAAVAVHTSDEPNAELLALAADERCQALVFKMAVATGFDAPRASVLVSLRNIASADFGTQIIGRIMRVAPQLRSAASNAASRAALPTLLDSGFIFLVAPDNQDGLVAAAQRIGNMRPAMRSVAGDVAVVISDGAATVVGPNQDLVQALSDAITPLTGHDVSVGILSQSEGAEAAGEQLVAQLADLFGAQPRQQLSGQTVTIPPPSQGLVRYPLKPEAPRRFLTERLPASLDGIPEAIAAAVAFTDAQLLLHNRAFAQIVVDEADLFEACQRRRTFDRVAISETRVAQKAQSAFAFSPSLDPVLVALALRAKLGRELDARGVEHNPQSLSRTLSLIIASDRRILSRAWRQALAPHIVCEPAGDLPAELVSFSPLEPSILNVYGVMPSDMNGWEQPFAEWLDGDEHGHVVWWHRNPSTRGPRTGHAVEIVRADGYGFYPDFIVGVQGRPTPDNVALAEVKERINDRVSVLKNRSEHAAYGRAKMIYYQEAQGVWQRVRYDEDSETNILDAGLFSIDALSTL